MAIKYPDWTGQQTLGSMFFGTAIAFILHGVACCQMVWFFRNQSGRSSKGLIAFIIFVWLMEAMNCAFMFWATLDIIFAPSVTYFATHTSLCSDWIVRGQSIPELLCTMSIEGFFIMRVWRLSEHKKLPMLLFIPYVASYAFGFIQLVQNLQQRCDLNASDLSPLLVYGGYGFKFFLDGGVATTMCFMLYSRSSGFTRRANTIKIVRGLILWSMSTGLLMWIVNMLFLLAIAGVISFGFVIFFITGGVYVNAMFAQLNARARFRTIAEASIPLSTIGLGETSSSEPVDGVLQPLDDDA